MSNLYEIDNAILECIDAETGELIDYERFESLQMERNQKIENVALWYKNLQADATAYKAEKEAFAERQKQAEAKAESLKRYLSAALEGQKFSTNRCAISFRKSVQVEISDESIIPKDFMIQTVTEKPDKMAIKDYLKQGNEVRGCRLVENQNIQIK